MQRRRRRSFTGLLLVLCLVLAVSAALLLRADDNGKVAHAPPMNSWNQTHRVNVPSGWTITQRTVSALSESTSLEGPGGKGCLVSTSSSEPASNAWPQVRKHVTVQGGEGSYGQLDPDFGPYPRAVIWQDASKRWFSVSCDLEEGEILGLAQRVQFGPNPMRVPFRLSEVPEQLSLTTLLESYQGAHRATAQFEVPGGPRPLTMEISNLPDRSVIAADGDVERGRIAGRQVDIRKASQSICFPPRSHPVCIFGPSDEPASDWSAETKGLALQTAELLSPVADPDNDSSWLDADQALPK